MPPLVVLVLVLVAAPASASGPSGVDDSAATGFPIALAVLAVVATILALVWRAVSKKKQDRAGR